MIQNKKANPKASFSIKTIGRGDRIRIGLPYEQCAEGSDAAPAACDIAALSVT
jgi:hypothetical protein